MSPRSTSPELALASALVVAGLLGLSAMDVSGHGGQFLGPPVKPVRLPTGVQPPSDPITGWWDANIDSLANQDAVGPVVTSGGVDPDLARRKVREDKIVPFLRSVLAGEHGTDADLMASATIALAKNSSDPIDVEQVLLFSEEPKNPGLMLDAAALAPGLFRRSNPKARFDASVYDKIRGRCLALYDGRMKSARRARCLAILAIGLLGDQPTRAGAGPEALAVPNMSKELWSRFKAAKGDEEQVALVAALGLQAPATIAPDVLEALRHLAATGEIGAPSCPDLVRAHAIIAIARAAGPDASGVLLRLVRSPESNDEIRNAAMVGLGVASPRLFPAARAAAATEVAAFAERGNPVTLGIALRTLGRIFAAAMRDPTDRATLGDAPASLLLKQIDGASFDARSFAALSTGFALRPAVDLTIDPDDVRSAFRKRGVAALLEIEADRTPPDLRGIVLLALGLSRDRAALPRLTALAGRRDVDQELRARAATALGLLGDRSSGCLSVLREALGPRSPDGVRREAARALGFLGDAAALPPLLAELDTDLSDTVRSRAAVALGALRRIEAIDPLIALASDKHANGLTRAIAIAALGLLGDPERIRSITRLATDPGGAASTDAISQALSLL